MGACTPRGRGRPCQGSSRYRCRRRITSNLWVGSFGRSRSYPVRISFITLDMPIVVLFNFILFYHLLWHNGCIDLPFFMYLPSRFCVRLIISIAHRPKRLACFARCCSKVSPRRHWYNFLPSTHPFQSRIYFLLLTIGPQPVETWIFKNKLPRDQKCFAKLLKVDRSPAYKNGRKKLLNRI